MPKECETCNYLLEDTIKLYQQEEPTLTRKPIEHCPTCGDKVIDA